MVKYDCSIISYAWIDRRQISIIIFLVNYGTMFAKSINVSPFMKSREKKKLELLDKLVDEIGKQNMVQIIAGIIFPFEYFNYIILYF